MMPFALAIAGLTVTPFDGVFRLKPSLEPFEHLWTLFGDFTRTHHRWMRGPVGSLRTCAPPDTGTR